MRGDLFFFCIFIVELGPIQAVAFVGFHAFIHAAAHENAMLLDLNLVVKRSGSTPLPSRSITAFLLYVAFSDIHQQFGKLNEPFPPTQLLDDAQEPRILNINDGWYECAVLHRLTQSCAVVADALKHLLDEFHEAVVIDGFRQLDNAEMTLTLLGLAAGQTGLVGAANAHARVVEPASCRSAVAVELGVREFNNGPAILRSVTTGTISSLLSKVNLMLLILASSAVECRRCTPDCFI